MSVDLVSSRKKNIEKKNKTQRIRYSVRNTQILGSLRSGSTPVIRQMKTNQGFREPKTEFEDTPSI